MQPARVAFDTRAMANTALFALLSASLATACGAVADDPEPTGTRTDHGELDYGVSLDDTAAPESPLVIDAPRAAATARSLFQISLGDHASVVALVGGGAEPQVDVVEQRIVTKDAEPVALDISIAAPTGTFSRVIASDAIREQYQILERVVCENGDIATYDPRCETTAPMPTSTPANGAITALRWRLWVRDEQTGATVDGCSAIGTELGCTLPGRAAAVYRVIASVDGVADLWGGTMAATVGSLAGTGFTGATHPQYRCTDWETNGDCRLYWKFTRYTAIDRATLDLDPIHIELTAGGVTSAADSPALTWDGGDDDLPGMTY
jgi:hypothetical protein